MFSQLKRWIQRHANLVLPLYPELVLKITMRECVKANGIGVNLFRHCGYSDGALEDVIFGSPREE